MAEINQNIRNFYDQAASRDFSRDFLFRVTSINITATNNAAAQSKNVALLQMADSDLVYVRTATLPGRDINNVEAKYMGLSFNIPGGVTYPNSGAFSLEFYCDSKSVLREQFMRASFDTFDDSFSTGLYATPDTNSYITLTQLDKDLNATVSYTLWGVSIRNVGEIAYEIAEGTGNYKTFPVTFAYHYWTSKSADGTGNGRP